VTGNKSIVFRFADVEVREREFCLVKAGKVLPVEPKTFRVLLHLLRNPQKLIAKEDLLNAVWGNAVVTDSSLTRTITQLRRLLGDEIRNPRYIETVATVGYRLLCKVDISEDASGSLNTGSMASGLNEGNLVGVPAAAATNSLENSTEGVMSNEKDGGLSVGRTNWLMSWLLSGAMFVIVLAVPGWYLSRPLPPLRVAQNGYTQITHDGRLKNLAGTDGSRLYFTRASGLQGLAQVAISGGETVPIPTELPVFSLEDVSPNGSWLLVTSLENGSGEGSLWSVQIPAVSLRQLRDIQVNSAAWSPDGKAVVYSTGKGELNVIGSDGTGDRRLGEVGAIRALSWSPDGSRIRFFRESRLWEISSDGSGLHAVLPAWRPSSPLCCGRWTADGNFFVFLLQHPFRGGYEPENQIWTLDERRRGLLRRPPAAPAQLTSGPIRWNTPIPSKDGTKIFAQGVIPRGELVRFDAQSHQLQPWLGGISAEYVSLSPNGQFVAYVSFPDGILWRAKRDGSDPVQLTNPPMYPVNPRWSPNGTQILFSQIDADGHFRSYLIPSHGGNTPQPLLPDEKEGTGDANWSPDGRKIVYCSVRSMEAIGSFKYDIRVLDVESHRIATLPAAPGTFSPRWSPNGRFIAGIHLGTPGGLAVFDFETQRWEMLHLKGEVDWPTWSSNSQFIYFLRSGDDSGVFRVRVSDGVEERVIDLRGFHHTGALLAWFGLDSQDTPLLIRDVGTADIYALTLEQK
jgi:DNA-binding winged helix-turn-helix (wHTH) protein/Tol biopolymer transport system component